MLKSSADSLVIKVNIEKMKPPKRNSNPVKYPKMPAILSGKEVSLSEYIPISAGGVVSRRCDGIFCCSVSLEEFLFIHEIIASPKI